MKGIDEIISPTPSTSCILTLNFKLFAPNNIILIKLLKLLQTVIALITLKGMRFL